MSSSADARADGVVRVALVTHGFDVDGGTATLTTFLHKVLTASGRYAPDIVSMATSRADAASARLTAPATWRRGPIVRRAIARGLPFYEVGASIPELEFQRYKPRRVLSELLRQWDVIQFVVGVPTWLSAAADLDKPVFLYTATTLHADRVTRLRQASWLRRQWLRLMTRLSTSAQRRALARADFVFALSRYTYDSLRPFVDAARMIVAPCGVDTDRFRPGAAPAANGCVLSVGRFADPRKNVRLLLAAYAELVSTAGECPPLVLAGSELLPADRAFASALGIADRIDVRGGVTDRELEDLYRTATMFVLSSDEEGLGIVLLEAMASGVPVIATRCGGPETLVRSDESGRLVDVGDVHGLASAMAALLEQPDVAAQMGRRGRAIAEREYSVRAAGEVFLQTYDRHLSITRSA